MSWSPQLIDLTRPDDARHHRGARRASLPNRARPTRISSSRICATGTRTTAASANGRLNDHFGTHLDAPIHIIPNTPGVDGVEIDRLIGEAVVIDCSFANGRGITSEDFEKARPRVKPGDIVLIYSAEQPATSMDDYIHNQTFVTPDGAEWLVKQQIKSVGVEPYGFEHLYEGIFVHKWYDKSTPPPHWPAHTICLQENVYILEGLGNLESIVGKRVRFSALPLPVPDSSGSPVRAVAWEEG